MSRAVIQFGVWSLEFGVRHIQNSELSIQGVIVPYFCGGGAGYTRVLLPPSRTRKTSAHLLQHVAARSTLRLRDRKNIADLEFIVQAKPDIEALLAEIAKYGSATVKRLRAAS